MKLIIALAFAVCAVSFQVRAQGDEAEGGAPPAADPDALREPVDPDWLNRKGNDAINRGLHTLLTGGSVGEAATDVLTGVTSTTDTIIDTVGKAALSIVSTVVGLVFTPLGLLLGIVLMLLGVGGTVLSVAGTVSGIVGGLCPVAVGLVGTVLDTVMTTVGSILGGLGKK